MDVGVPIVAAISLAIASLFTAAYAITSTKKRRHMSVTVKWGRERLRIPLPNDLNAPLSTLRNSVAELTSLPPSSFKLIHAGAIMKDDNTPLSSYGIRPNSTIALIGGGAPIPEPASVAAAAGKKQKSTEPATEINTIASIHSELSRVNENIVPALDAFLAFICSSPSESQAEATYKPPQSMTLEQEHTRLGELLLQSLLRLDVIEMDGAWTDARKERKEAIRFVQSKLDRLDSGWKERVSARQNAQL